MPMTSILLKFIHQSNQTNLETPLQLSFVYCSLCRTNHKYLQHHLFQMMRLLSTAYLAQPVSSVLYFMLACNGTFVGYNCMYGNSRSYSTDLFVVGHLIRELQGIHFVIPHFIHSELDVIVTLASTM